jgi:hypothetical protein
MYAYATFRALRRLSCCLLTQIVSVIVPGLPSVMLESVVLDFHVAIAMGWIPKSRHVLSKLVLNFASTRNSQERNAHIMLLYP